MNYWLVKSEPIKYSWERFVEDGKAVWDGVRNYQARNNLMAMKLNDKVLYYHSNEGMNVVGVAEIIKEYYQDPTTEDKRWVVVELKPLHPINPVSLETMKKDDLLQNIGLIKQSRLSVMRLKTEEFDRILALSSL
jgi:predicted RNA-binding protein with PUA-like domain